MVMKMENESLIGKIVQIVEDEGRPVDINLLATKIGVHWITVYKAIADFTFEDLRDNHRSVLYAMEIIPLKTTKSLIIIPKGTFTVTVKEETAKI